MRKSHFVGVTVAAIAWTVALAAGGLVTPDTDVVVDDGELAAIDSSTLPSYKSLTVGDRGSGALDVGGFNFATVAGPARLGMQREASGSMHLRDYTSALEVHGPLTVGVAGAGAIDVDGTSLLVDLPINVEVLPPGLADTVLGDAPTGSGSIVVDGSDARFNEQGSIVIGRAGRGSLHVTDLASLSARADIYVARETGAGGEVLVDESASLGARNLYLGGDATRAGGTATLTLDNNSSIGADHATLWRGSRVTLANSNDDFTGLGARFDAAQVDVRGGTLAGFGEVGGNVVVSDGGTLEPDNIEMNGDTLTLERDSRLLIDLPALGKAGVVGLNFGDANIDRSKLQLHLDPADRDDPLLGDLETTFILLARHIFGHFANAPFDGSRVMSDDGFGSFRVNYLTLDTAGGAQAVSLSDFRAGPITAIPLPPGVWSGLATLCALAAFRAAQRGGRGSRRAAFGAGGRNRLGRILALPVYIMRGSSAGGAPSRSIRSIVTP